MPPAATKAPVPDTFYQTYRPRLERRIDREMRAAHRIVEVGCGNCQLATRLADTDGREVIGVDIRDANFPQPPGRVPHRRCVHADARHLDFLATGTIDAVVAVWALHELAAPMAVLREAKRTLRPGGELLIVDFPKGSLAQRLWNERYYTTTQVAQMLKRAGLARVEARRIARSQITWARGYRPARAPRSH